MAVLCKLYAKFIEFKQCKNNPKYYFMNFVAEDIYMGTTLIPSRPNLQILIDDESPFFKLFQPSQIYLLCLEPRLEPAKNNYPARINFQLYKVTHAPQQTDLKAQVVA